MDEVDRFNSLGQAYLGAKMPTYAGVLHEDRRQREAAAQGSAALLRAIQRYFERRDPSTSSGQELGR